MNIFKNSIPIPQEIALKMLSAELPLILLSAVITLVCYLGEAEHDPVLAALHFAEAPTYILASLALSVVTALLCDLAQRRAQQ